MKPNEMTTKAEQNSVNKEDKDVKKKLHGHSVWKALKGVFSLQVYKVVVNNGTKSWFIFRRYNEFHSLYEKVGCSIIYYINLLPLSGQNQQMMN